MTPVFSYHRSSSFRLLIRPTSWNWVYVHYVPLPPFQTLPLALVIHTLRGGTDFNSFYCLTPINSKVVNYRVFSYLSSVPPGNARLGRTLIREDMIAFLHASCFGILREHPGHHCCLLKTTRKTWHLFSSSRLHAYSLMALIYPINNNNNNNKCDYLEW